MLNKVVFPSALALALLAAAEPAIAEQRHAGAEPWEFHVAEVLEKLAEADPSTPPDVQLRAYLVPAGASIDTPVVVDDASGVWRVELTFEQRNAFENLLDGIRRGGARQVVFRTWWLDLPSVEAIGDIDWDAATRFPSSPTGLSTLAAPGPAKGVSGAMEAASTKTIYGPYLATVLSRPQAVDLLDRVQQSARTGVLSAPSVTCFNGQQAVVADSSTRPFVVGVKRVVGEHGEAMQPVIATIDQGRQLGVRGIALASGEVEVGLRLEDVRVDRVDKVRLPGARETTVQAPHVDSSVITAHCSLAKGEAILLAPTVAPAREDGRFRCCLVAAEPIEPARFSRAPAGDTRRVARR